MTTEDSTYSCGAGGLRGAAAGRTGLTTGCQSRLGRRGRGRRGRGRGRGRKDRGRGRGRGEGEGEGEGEG